MKRKNINKFKGMNTKRFRRGLRWINEGRKDGACGIFRDLSAVPKVFRECYNSGHTLGATERALA